MTATVFVINGPNLNLLGDREPEIYGTETLADIEAACVARGRENGLDVRFFQSNHEGDLIGWVHEARKAAQGLVVNAGAYTHTSIALFDALSACKAPVIEVHLSNIHRRESFRHHSWVAGAATGMICGLGSHGYLLALDALARLIGKTSA